MLSVASCGRHLSSAAAAAAATGVSTRVAAPETMKYDIGQGKGCVCHWGMLGSAVAAKKSNSGPFPNLLMLIEL